MAAAVYRRITRMSDDRFTWATVRDALRREGLRHAFTRGRGGPLLFVWVLGAGILLTVLNAVPLAGLFSLGCLGLLVPIVRESLAGEATQPALIGEILERRFPVADLSDPALRDEAGRGLAALTEMALKIRDAERRGRAPAALERVFADAAGLVDLQLESAVQAEELERVLAIVERNNGSPGASPMAGSPSSIGSDDLRLRDENIRTVRAEAAGARQMTTTITHRLETMLLQASQMERETIDLVRAEEAARESSEAVARLQDVVNARRAAAARLAATLSPDEDYLREGA